HELLREPAILGPAHDHGPVPGRRQPLGERAPVGDGPAFGGVGGARRERHAPVPPPAAPRGPLTPTPRAPRGGSHCAARSLTPEPSQTSGGPPSGRVSSWRAASK